ncbi:hypothetical protein QJS10_CPB04g01377 [Acorus calamus]|uniref:Riboflavin biosynthesis protein PYRR, chloroplastic n=1 Tax=Acorus calamus TaxID=4465 RepID=A0AAV9EZ25_ACOCL|nr:hypothetical protein QJS10_CPB04g01377 [Acorus calamus]
MAPTISLAAICSIPQQRKPFPSSIRNSANHHHHHHHQDSLYIRRAAEIADKSAGITAPHPNFGCVIATARAPDASVVVGEGFLHAQGTKCAELQAVEAAGELARGSTAYLNMEPGDCYGDHTPVSSLVRAGISRVVVGIRHPLRHLRGKAIFSLRNQGIQVDVLGEDLQTQAFEIRNLFLASNRGHPNENEVLNSQYCAWYHRIRLSAAVTLALAGKIAASSGHASWVSSKLSRDRVFELRGRSDAIIVGGNTVRRDDPRLTARHGGGHVPVRIVMSQTLDLPEDRNLWDTSDAFTIVATQRGARKDFQQRLALKGVERCHGYFYDRGYLSILWECGGTLSAAAISCNVIHKVYAFIAAKIIGGKDAPSPVGELGMVEMSQARCLTEVSYETVERLMKNVYISKWFSEERTVCILCGIKPKATKHLFCHCSIAKQIGPDLLISGYLQPIPDLSPIIPSVDEISMVDPTVIPYDANIIFFYETWDPYGVLSNFSPHPLCISDDDGNLSAWPSVEHYYQASKSLTTTLQRESGFYVFNSEDDMFSVITGGPWIVQVLSLQK